MSTELPKQKLPHIDVEHDNEIRYPVFCFSLFFIGLFTAFLEKEMGYNIVTALAVGFVLFVIMWPYMFSPDVYVLQVPWVMKLRCGHEVTIPAGYRFDGATVPRALWSITGFTPYGKHLAAALEHDRLCELKGVIVDDQGGDILMPWWEVHMHFYHKLVEWNVRPVKCKLMALAVFIGGPKWTLPKNNIDDKE